MPRYFFDVDDGVKRVRDETGTECDSDEVAGNRAVVTLPELARRNLPDGPHRIFSCDVRDGAGRMVCRAMMSLTVVWAGASRR